MGVAAGCLGSDAPRLPRPARGHAAVRVVAQIPPGEATRLDPFRARLAAEIQARLAETSGETDLLEAVERWELALFHEGPLRADELREALEALLGCDEGPWAAAMRASVLLGETARERSDLLTAFRALLDGDGPGARAEDAVRRALVETLLHGNREELVLALADKKEADKFERRHGFNPRSLLGILRLITGR